jgi:outer membrane protein TolC
VSEYFPQLYASAGYTRTLRSEFQGIGEDGDTTSAGPSEECDTFTPDPTLPLAARVDSLESAVRCASTANPFAAFSDLPFGREHQYNVGLSVSQTVFSGGRVQAQNRISAASRRRADIALNTARAQLALDVTEAYYEAVLSDRLLAIAEATLGQAESTLGQVRLARDVGEQPEFELLRAQVTFENQRPVVIRRAADRTLAYIRLKQLLDVPLAAPLELTSDLDDAELTPVVRLAAAALGLPLDTLAPRAPVRLAEEAVRAQEGLLAVARAQRLPSLALASQYGRVLYPQGMVSDFGAPRTNWTVSASVQLPVFTGGRIAGDEMVARADLDEASAVLEQTRELAALDSRSASERLEAALASWRASAGTVEQATRAYAIAEIRFQEGISTQLELNDSRILLQQAQANRAVAARDLQVARVRVALLPYLPFGDTGAAASGAAVPRQTAPGAQQAGQAQAGSGSVTTTGFGRTAATAGGGGDRP